MKTWSGKTVICEALKESQICLFPHSAAAV